MKSSVYRFSNLLLASFLLTYFVHCQSNEAQPAEEFDWRQEGVIAPVFDNGEVGGETAPVVIAEGVESLQAIESEQSLVLLSRQQVADTCDEDYHPLTHGYTCIVLSGGLCKVGSYRPLKPRPCEPEGKVIGTEYVPRYREDLMLEIIHKTPLTATLDASHESFKNYVGGIYSESKCSTDKQDHFVQIVGYGTTNNGQDYWIIKNSWGTGWGEEGYMRISRGRNMCGIAAYVFYPLI